MAVVRLVSSFAGLTLGVFAYDNGGAGAYPMRGWSTWSTDDIAGLLDFCYEKEIHEIADALVSTGMRALNYTTLLLDDCL